MKASSIVLGWLSFVLVGTALADQEIGGRLINGTPVPAGQFPEIINIKSGNSGCTATVVGPRVFITASHCAGNGATATFTLNGAQYSGKVTRSPLYVSGKDHDVALAVVSQDITGITPATIGGSATVGKELTLYGYGCTTPIGNGQAIGGNDGILRTGTSVITRFAGYDMVSTKPGGAALCYGDSGGPAFVTENGKRLLIGINSKGNIKDTNYNARLDSTESQNFMKDFASQNGVDICGVNSDCNGSEPPPADKPSCQLVSEPGIITLGQSVTLQMTTTGTVTSASINGTSVSFPTGQLTLTPSTAGTFTATGSVTGPGGTGACSANYTVQGNQQPEAPTCTLTATPSLIELGQSVVIRIQVAGQATAAVIDGQSVTVPTGQITVTPTQVGQQQSHGLVSGPGGQGQCRVTYAVEDSTPQPIPDLTVVNAYCGSNTQGHPDIKEVCLAVLKSITGARHQYLREVLVITYQNATKEVMPIIHRKDGVPSGGTVKEEVTTYANLAVKDGQYLVLDTRKAVVTKTVSSGMSGAVPRSLEGRSASGKYFIVESLGAP